MNKLNHALENTAPDALYDQQEQAEFERSIEAEQLARQIVADPELLGGAFGNWLEAVGGSRLFGILSEICADPLLDSSIYELRGYIKGVAEWNAERLIERRSNDVDC